MLTGKKIFEVKNESLKTVLDYIKKETRRQKYRKKKIDEVTKRFAEDAKQDALYYDKSAKLVVTKGKFLQIYPFKFNLNHNIKYVFDTIKDLINAKIQQFERSKVFKIFFREMAIMLHSGLQLVPALDIAKDHTPSKRFKEVLERIIYDLKANGTSFTNSIKRFPAYFSKLYFSIIKAGETSCSLPVVFEELAQLEEKYDYLRNRLKSAMVYPIFVLIFSLGMLFIIGKMLVPAIVSLAKGFEIKGMAKLVVFTAAMFSNPLSVYVCAAIVVFFTLLAYIYIRTPEGKYKWDKFRLSIPVLGDALTKICVIQFCIILHILYKSGISIATSTRILSEVFENSYIKSRFSETLFPRVNAGHQLSLALKELGFFPPVALQLISTGEESGRLVELLKKVIDIYKFEVEDTLVKLSNILEPIIIMAFGALICFIAVISLLPIYQVVANM